MFANLLVESPIVANDDHPVAPITQLAPRCSIARLLLRLVVNRAVDENADAGKPIDAGAVPTAFVIEIRLGRDVRVRLGLGAFRQTEPVLVQVVEESALQLRAWIGALAKPGVLLVVAPTVARPQNRRMSEAEQKVANHVPIDLAVEGLVTET